MVVVQGYFYCRVCGSAQWWHWVVRRVQGGFTMGTALTSAIVRRGLGFTIGFFVLDLGPFCDEDYLNIREDMGLESNRFFLVYNLKGIGLSSYLKNQRLGRNKSSKIGKPVCSSPRISITGVKHGMTTHGLKLYCSNSFSRVWPFGLSIAMRTGHCDPRSLKNHQNIQGRKGEKQQ